MVRVNPFRWSTQYTDDETDLVMYPARPYSPSTGRFLCKDPIAEQGGLNVYAFVANNPVNAVDMWGLWGTDVHFHRTRTWGVDLSMPLLGALTIGDYDDKVDSDFSPYTFSDANWKWHFDRSGGGKDSRLQLNEDELNAAKAACTNPKDDWLEAAKHMGRSLHPLQDWVAHGDFNRRSEAPYIASVHGIFMKLRYAHNKLTKQAGMGWESVDDPSLDSDGPDGRATFNVLKFAEITSVGDRLYWANFHGGTQRIKLTETKTKAVLGDFMKHVREKGKPCGKCQQNFLPRQ